MSKVGKVYHIRGVVPIEASSEAQCTKTDADNIDFAHISLSSTMLVP